MSSLASFDLTFFGIFLVDESNISLSKYVAEISPDLESLETATLEVKDDVKKEFENGLIYPNYFANEKLASHFRSKYFDSKTIIKSFMFIEEVKLLKKWYGEEFSRNFPTLRSSNLKKDVYNEKEFIGFEIVGFSEYLYGSFKEFSEFKRVFSLNEHGLISKDNIDEYFNFVKKSYLSDEYFWSVVAMQKISNLN